MLFRQTIRTLLFLSIGLVLLFAVIGFSVMQPLFPASHPQDVGTVDPARLERHVRMISETLSPRDWRHPGNLDKVADYIKTEMGRAGGMVSEQPYAMDGNTYRNVIGAFGPEAGERVVIGAHYDAFGPYPAADDDASGVAGLIELAHQIGKASLSTRVDLVAFTLEEPRAAGERGLFRGPYGGSAVHAKALKEKGVAVRMMLSLEMLGFYSDEDKSQGYPSPMMRLAYPSPGNYILIVGRLQDGWRTRSVKKLMQGASSLPIYSINAPASLEGIDWSDHASYWAQGYPALMITDTALNRNHNYHTEKDTAERLDYGRMAKAVQAVYAAVVGTAAPQSGAGRL